MASQPIKYVCGFGFYYERDILVVVLMRKSKPEWQNGKLNGIGGKVEVGETYHQAMTREFHEEAGISRTLWTHFATQRRKDVYECRFFTLTDSAFSEAKTCESVGERVEHVRVDKLHSEKFIIENLKWLIPLARYYPCRSDTPIVFEEIIDG